MFGKNTYRQLHKRAASFLLVLYAFSMLLYAIQFEHKHNHATVECNHETEIHESDPCHLKLVHHDLINGCKHDTHVSIPVKHCALCDLVLHFDAVILCSYPYCCATPYFKESLKHITNFYSNTSLFNPCRGPPQLS